MHGFVASLLPSSSPPAIEFSNALRLLTCLHLLRPSFPTNSHVVPQPYGGDQRGEDHHALPAVWTDAAAGEGCWIRAGGGFTEAVGEGGRWGGEQGYGWDVEGGKGQGVKGEGLEGEGSWRGGGSEGGERVEGLEEGEVRW